MLSCVQSRLQQKMQALQEENRALREAFKHGPSVTQLEKAHKQIGQTWVRQRGSSLCVGHAV